MAAGPSSVIQNQADRCAQLYLAADEVQLAIDPPGRSLDEFEPTEEYLLAAVRTDPRVQTLAFVR